MAERDVLPQRVVTLRDEETGVVEDMDVIVEFAKDDREYGLITPLAQTLRVVRVEDEDELDLEEIESEEALEGLLPAINDALKPFGVQARRHGPRLALEGELPDEVHEQGEEITVDADDEPESLLKIGELDADGATYWLLLPLEMELLPVELAGDEARPLGDEELEALDELFEEALADLDEQMRLHR